MNQRIKNCITILNYAIENKISIAESCRKHNFSRNYVANTKLSIDNLLSNNSITKQEYNVFNSTLEEWEKGSKISQNNNSEKERIKLIEQKLEVIEDLAIDKVKQEEDNSYDAYLDQDYDDRSYGEIIRDSEGKVDRYYYKILIRDSKPLEGFFSRDEMDVVYRLYSNMDGANLTQRMVVREFPHLTIRDFKRILRAFNITKQSIPVAPHILEEHTEQEVAEIVFKNKENNLLRILEHQRSRYFENAYLEARKEIGDLRNKFKDIEGLFQKFDFNGITPHSITQVKLDREKAIIVYLSDMHVGAKTEEDSLYQNDYNQEEIQRRMKLTLDKIYSQFKNFGRFDKIIVCNLGDCLDGYNQQTTRGGHKLPQNMNNRNQFKVYVQEMLRFVDTLHQMNISNSIDFVSVGDSNHGGDFEYVANKSLEYIFSAKYPDMNVRIFDKFIEHYNYGVHTFILSHGKDKEDMKHGFPLSLDTKTELYFSNYIDHHRLYTPNLHIVTGDLHQSLTQIGKRFRWKKVLSMYGGSKWIHTNFGDSRPGVDYEIVDKNSDEIFEGRVWF